MRSLWDDVKELVEHVKRQTEETRELHDQVTAICAVCGASVRGGHCPHCHRDLTDEELAGERPAGGAIEPTRLYTAKEAAPLIGVESKTTVYRMGRREQLKATRTGPRGGNVRFRGSDLLAYLESRRA